MKHKLRNIAWILLLLVLSVPTGYFVNYVDNKRFVESEYVPNLIVGGIACAFVFGMLSLILFIILKKRKVNDPSKPALLVSSVLMVIMLVVAAVQMPEAKKERARRAFMSEFRRKMPEIFTKRFKEMNAPPELTTHVDEICSCISWGMKKEPAMLDSFIADPDPLTFPTRNPKMKKITEDCFGLYLK
jgi:hypothetical protein